MLSLQEMAEAEKPPAEKRKKQPTFTEDELLVMVTEVAKRKQLVTGCFSVGVDSVSRKAKEFAWCEITAAVSGVNSFTRSEKDVRKKFRDYRSDVKRRVGQHRHRMQGTGKP